jgi:hypothetical protein
MTCVDRSMSSVCQRCQSTDCGHMDRGHIVSCHVVECHEVGYPVVIGDLGPAISGRRSRAGGIGPGVSGRGYRVWGIGSGSFPASSFFDREYRTILGLLAEPRKR